MPPAIMGLDTDMKANEEKKAHESREARHAADLGRARRRHGRRVPQGPARDDRAPAKAWRPGDR